VSLKANRIYTNECILKLCTQLLLLLSLKHAIYQPMRRAESGAIIVTNSLKLVQQYWAVLTWLLAV